jgi:Flp pilus assembly pilin Flp
MVEYALLVGLMALASIAGVSAVSSKLSVDFNAVLSDQSYTQAMTASTEPPVTPTTAPIVTTTTARPATTTTTAPTSTTTCRWIFFC